MYKSCIYHIYMLCIYYAFEFLHHVYDVYIYVYMCACCKKKYTYLSMCIYIYLLYIHDYAHTLRKHGQIYLHTCIRA